MFLNFIENIKVKLWIYFSVVFICIGCSKEMQNQSYSNSDNYNGYHVKKLSNLISSDQIGFKQLANKTTGIKFTNKLSMKEMAKNRHLMNGSGVAVGDVDGDGLVDIYFAGLTNSNKLYKNLGNMQFKDITQEAGVAHEGNYSTGVTFADIDGDKDLDLLVNNFGKSNTIYINNGDGKFDRRLNSDLEKEKEKAKGSTTMALADITGNGYPDLYITNYKKKSAFDIFSSDQLTWNNILIKPLNKNIEKYELKAPYDKHFKLYYEQNEIKGRYEIGEIDELYFNYEGRFKKVSRTDTIFLDQQGNQMGLQPDWGLTAKFYDMNEDGLVDLYICNDFETPDRIWINQGLGKFKEIESQKIRSLSNFSMAVAFSDINRDGLDDFFISEMLSNRHKKRLTQAGPEDPVNVPIGDTKVRSVYNQNSLLLQRKDHSYAQIARFSNIEATGWSWASEFLDIDLDGYEDLVISTGYAKDALDIDTQIKLQKEGKSIIDNYFEFLNDAPNLDLPNRVLRNNGDLTFSDYTENWGIAEADVSQGMALADLDNDGLKDVILNRLNKQSIIYHNQNSKGRISVRVIGRSPNTQAIGTKIHLLGGPVNKQTYQITVGGSYLSGSQPIATFAAPRINNNYHLEIIWSNGKKSIIDSVKTDRNYIIYEDSVDYNVNMAKTINPENELFFDVSHEIDHKHYEIAFPDFNLQALLPARLSRPGPGVMWLDYNNDTFEDLLITSGKGGRLSIFEASNKAKFTKANLEPLTKVASGDQTAVIGWKENKVTRIVVGSSNFEQKGPDSPSAYIYTLDNFGQHVKTQEIKGIHSTTGPLAAADIDGDKRIDLFIGGRQKPGVYPQNATSRLFSNQGDSFKLDKENSKVLLNVGNVTGAVFADFTQNGYSDLLLSTEWGSIKLFENTNGKIREVTKKFGLNKYHGWWNTVAVGDFTNNGRPDFVATNIGRNSIYQLENGYPVRFYYDDINGDGRIDIIDSYANKNGEYLPRNKLLTYQNHGLLYSSPSHTAFAQSTLSEIMNSNLDNIPFKKLNTLESMVFINKNGYFATKILPYQAQFTMANHAGVADFNNDGYEDLFLSQNFFAFKPNTQRLDAGRGLLMLGDGNANFKPVSGSESGLKIYGEQRGAAFGDYNKDGKVDLAVSQNGTNTKLYRNKAQNRGFLIKLKGPDTNVNAVGSSIRIKYKNGKKGPARYILAGSGYLSQDSYTQVLGAKTKGATGIEVHWFDGKISIVQLKKDEWVYNPEYND